MVRVDQAGFHAKRNHYLWKKKSSCHNHKDTKRSKQHFWFLYKKNLFKATVFISPQKKLHEYIEYKKSQRDYLVWSGSHRERKMKFVWYEFRWFKRDTYRSSSQDIDYLVVCCLSFVDKMIWIHKDSISISWFWSDQQDSTSCFRSVRCLSLWLLKMSQPLLQTDCLYGIRQRKDNFWPRPRIMICKSPWPPCIFIQSPNLCRRLLLKRF